MVVVIHKDEDAYKRGKGVINAFQHQCMDFVVIALFLGNSFIVIISNFVSFFVFVMYFIEVWKNCVKKCQKYGRELIEGGSKRSAHYPFLFLPQYNFLDAAGS